MREDILVEKNDDCEMCDEFKNINFAERRKFAFSSSSTNWVKGFFFSRRFLAN